MNNSMIIGEEKPVKLDNYLRARQTELLDIIEAINAIKASSHWKLLQRKVFDGVAQSLQNRIRTVTDTNELFRLQGQLGWADKYCDLDKLAKVYRDELEKVNTQLQNNG